MTRKTTLPLPAHQRQQAARWLGLAVGVLVLSGLLSVVIVVARLPVISTRLGDPLLFKRCLVVHVDLALVVWFYSFLAAISWLVPSRAAARASRAGVFVSASGVAVLIAAAAMPGVRPVLANYVPLLDTPAFLAGLALFAAGVALVLVSRRLSPGAEAGASDTPLPAPSFVGVRAAAVAFVAAMLTFLAAAMVTPASLPPDGYYELLFWGGGHVLQFASEAAMIACWLALVGAATGRAPLSRGLATGLFVVLVAPTLGAPLLALSGTTTPLYVAGFTRLMQWGVFPVVSVFLVLCLRALWRSWQHGEHRSGTLAAVGRRGFLVSAALTALGFVLGALVRGPNTMVPAHYHASIGGVTASFMALTYVVLESLGAPVPTPRLRRLATIQPVVFGVGQMVFAVGFGAAGMGRKSFGAEQHIRTLGETIGLLVMGVGGLSAVVGGLSFIVIAVASWRAASSRRKAWNANLESIQSNG